MLWYGILGIATGFWIYYDCKRIGYESKLKYLYLLLSVVLPPFFFVYLCVTGKQRKQGAKPCLVAHPLFWSVLCLAGCFVFVKTTPLPDMLETRYIKEKAVAESELERAKVRLAEMGTTEAVLHPMSENICWYMAEQLPEDARFVASGAVYGTDWMMGKEEAASLRFEVYLYERAAEATDSKRHFMAVSTFQWSDSVRIDYGRFKLLVPEGFAMEEQELKLRVWAKKTAAARYVDASVYGFGERMQGYQFVGKSMIAGYPYSGCVIAYFQGTDVPEEINFSYAHENGKTVGVVETVKLDFVSEQKRELFGTSETGNAAENHISKFEYSKELESKLAAEDLKQLKERLQGEFALEILEQTEAGLHVRVVA
ncbi:MAG: hypothetical protein IJY09_07345, partial [Lachnospiraceae bacterium]|nr:hypothetical protein [Lachnospiraceae bacterium]